MVVRGLDDPVYLRERKLLQTAPLSSLQNTRLGIDVNHYLRTELSDPEHREPLVVCTGGVPLGLINHIEQHTRILSQNGVTPLFVFGGLPLSYRNGYRGAEVAPDRELAVKNEAWSHYENGNVDKAISVLSTVRGGAWTDHKDLTRLMLRLFRHRSTEYVVAPYLEMAQLAYLMSRSYAHCIYSNNEALIWPVDRVITSINWETSTVSFIDKTRLLSDLGLNQDQFLDLAILAGCSLSQTFPPIAGDFSFRAVVDLIKQYNSGIGVCQSWRADGLNKAQLYGDLFLKTRLAVKYSLVMTTEGKSTSLALVTPTPQPITAADVPENIDDIFTWRLPDEVYFHLCRGLISPQVLGWIATGQIEEAQPWVDTPEYQLFVKEIITEGPTSPRSTAMGLLADALHAHWKSRKVSIHYWFDNPSSPPSVLAFSDAVTQERIQSLARWMVFGSFLDDELRRQKSSTIDIKLCVGALTDPQQVKATHRGAGAKILERKDELVANILWRLLDLRGFTDADHSLKISGRALQAALNQSRVNDRLQEALVLVLELLRAGVLHDAMYREGPHGPLSGGPSLPTPDDERHMLLVMRVFGTLNLTCRPQYWQGPLSREALALNAFIKALIQSLRQLLEAVSVHLLLSGDARRNRDDFHDVMLSGPISGLPFQSDINTGFALLINTWISILVIQHNDSVITAAASSSAAREAKEEALKMFDEGFAPAVKNPIQELERGLRFWDAVMVAIRSIKDAQGPAPKLKDRFVDPKILQQFEDADDWLRPQRP